MDCQRITEWLDKRVDGLSDDVPGSAFAAHLDQCPRCRHRFAAAGALRDALRALPAPEPRPGFTDRALAVAVERGRRRERLPGLLVPAALAAGLALIVGLAVFLARPEIAAEPLQIALQEDRPQTVRLVFETPHALRDVTVSVHLPGHIALEGYPGQRILSWNTSLREGRNLLALPVIPHADGSGILHARLAMGDEARHFRLRINVAPGAGDAQLREPAVQLASLREFNALGKEIMPGSN